MSEVIIAGIGQTDVGEHYSISLRDLAFMALEATIQDAGGLRPDILFIGNMLAPTASHQAHLGALISDYGGLGGIEASTIEAGGASGAAALRMGYLAIKSGEARIAMVLGVEKVTDQLGPEAESAQTLGEDSDYEAVQGVTPNAQAALLMRRYMHEHQVSHKAFAGFPITAHANAVTNPHAMYHSPLTLDAYQNADPISDPLNMFDIAPPADSGQIAQLEQSLTKAANLRVVAKGGAEDGSAWVEIDLAKSIALLDILKRIPNVKDVVGAKSYIIVAMKAKQTG